MNIATSPICILYLFYDAYFCTWTGIWDLSVDVTIRVPVELPSNSFSIPGTFKIFFCPPAYSGYFLGSHSAFCSVGKGDRFDRAKGPER